RPEVHVSARIRPGAQPERGVQAHPAGGRREALMAPLRRLYGPIVAARPPTPARAPAPRQHSASARPAEQLVALLEELAPRTQLCRTRHVQARAVHVLESMQEHRPVLLFEDVAADLDDE